MAVLEILRYPHPLLKKRCKKIETVDEEIRELVHQMTETMYDANGIGLAANQVGVPLRVIVVDVSPIDPQQEFLALINPEIISEEGEIDHEEGCLSVPDCFEKVKRKEKISVRGLSPEGKDVSVSGEGILGFAIQHEIDHLNGILILDRVSGLKREIYRRKIKKEKKKEEKE
jgi:peptide deformylase